MSSDNHLAVLITIPVSHYCEKARWALDRVGMPYREEGHIPVLHRLATWRQGSNTVPSLVHGGRRFADSTDILVYADAICGGDGLYPRDATLRRDVDTLEELFDTQLGPHTRRWAYAHMLSDAKLTRESWSRRVPWSEALVLRVLGPVALLAVLAKYRITPASGRRSLECVRGVFRDVDQLLADGRRFLVGDRFTAADLTFASLAAPALFPPECRSVLPALEAVPAAVRDEVLRLRETAAGQFALRIFAQERAVSVTQPQAR